MTDHSADLPDRDAIAIRAYEIWQQRGCPQGTAERDWAEAEAELRSARLLRLEASRLHQAPAPVGEYATPVALASEAPGAAAPTDAPAKRRRRAPAAAATPIGATGTRVTRKRPARPDA